VVDTTATTRRWRLDMGSSSRRLPASWHAHRIV